MDKADATFEKELAEKNNIIARLTEIEELGNSKKVEYDQLVETAKLIEIQPQRLARQTDAISNAVKNLESELQSLQKIISKRNTEIEKQAKRKAEAAKLKSHLEEQLELHRQTLEKREQDVSILRAKLENEKSKNHDLVTRKMELNLKKRECESNLRYRSDQLAIAKKEYEGLKRLYKKKVSITDAAKVILPDLEMQLSDVDALVALTRKQIEQSSREAQDLKDELEVSMQRLLTQGDIEKEKREVRGWTRRRTVLNVFCT